MRGEAIGNIFPQKQIANGSFRRNAVRRGANPSGVFGVNRFSDSWNYGFNLNWELDFWGRFRRAIASADANLDASVYDYDYVLVTLLGDVATQLRARSAPTRNGSNCCEPTSKSQQGIFDFIHKRAESGLAGNRLDLDQAVSNLRQTEAAIPQLEIDQRQAENALCVLLGIPTADLTNMLGAGPIPTAPPERGHGHSRRPAASRPDVRRAERLAAAQAEQIGIAEADFYPAFSINGTLGYAAQNFPDLFRYTAFNGSFGPSFQWNVLNYGRIVNNVRYQDAKFQELVAAYQNTVLQADEEVENGLITFLRSQRAHRLLEESVQAAERAGQHRHRPIQSRLRRLQPLRHDRAEPRGATGRLRPVDRPDRPRSHPSLSGDGRRLGDPALRPAAGAGNARCAECRGASPRSHARHTARREPAGSFAAGSGHSETECPAVERMLPSRFRDSVLELLDGTMLTGTGQRLKRLHNTCAAPRV